jgi:hypothetical protein
MDEKNQNQPDLDSLQQGYANSGYQQINPDQPQQTYPGQISPQGYSGQTQQSHSEQAPLQGYSGQVPPQDYTGSAPFPQDAKRDHFKRQF